MSCDETAVEDMRCGPNLSLWSMKLSFMFWPSDVEYRRSSDSVTSMFGGAPWDTFIVYTLNIIYIYFFGHFWTTTVKLSKKHIDFPGFSSWVYCKQQGI